MRKYLTRTVLLLSLVSLFTDISSEMLYPVLPLYLKTIGFSALGIGLLEGIASAIIGLSTGYFGAWSDRTGKRLPFVKSGYVMSAFSKPLMVLSAQPLWIFVLRLIERTGKGVRTGARDAMLAGESTAGHSGKVFSFHRAMDTLGAVVGPLIALIYLYFHPGEYIALFLIAFGPALLGVLILIFIRDRKEETKTKEGRGQWKSIFNYPRRAGKNYRLILAGLTVFAVFNSSDAFLFLRLRDAGLSDHSLLIAYIGYNLVFAAAAVPAGYLADRIGKKPVVVAGILMFSLAYVLFALGSSMFVAAMGFIVYGFFGALTEGVAKAWLADHCDKSEKGLAMGFYKAVMSIMMLVASLMTGWIWVTFSPGIALSVSALGAILSAVLLLLLCRRSGA